jgi:hypothetical protein
MLARRSLFWLPSLMVASLGPVFAAEPCAEYKWDVSNERALYAGASESVTSGASVEKAPSILPGRLYAVALQPQEALRFPAAPSKKMLADGASAGLLKLRIAEAGRYRISVDTGLWLDVVRDGKLVESHDFQGITECKAPRKIVLYDLPAGIDVYLQASASSASSVRLSVTRATPQ